MKVLNIILLLVPTVLFGYNQEHLDQLLSTGSCINQKDIKGGCDLTNAPLRGYSLKNSQLEYADLSGADLSGAHLRNINLEHATLHGTIFNSAFMVGAKLSYTHAAGAQFSGTHLSNSTFTGAILVELQGNFVEEANFTSANLTNAVFTKSHLQGAILDHANLENANFAGSTGTYSHDDNTNYCCTTMSDGKKHSEVGSRCTKHKAKACELNNR